MDKNINGNNPLPEQGQNDNTPSTPSVEILATKVSQDRGNLLGDDGSYNELSEFIAKDGNGENANLGHGVKLLEQFYSSFNMVFAENDGVMVRYSIMMGKALLQLKAMIKAEKGKGVKWGEWSKENLAFMSPRTRQVCMQLANHDELLPLAYLGKERLLHILRAVKGSNTEAKAVEKLLQKYNILMDPKTDKDRQEFKVSVDAMVATEKLKKHVADVPFKKIRERVVAGVRFDEDTINATEKAVEDGCDLREHLDSLKKGGSKKANSPKAMAKKLPATVSALTEALDTILGDENLMPDIGREEIQSVMKKLEELASKLDKKEE